MRQLIAVVVTVIFASYSASAAEPATVAVGEILRGRYVQERHLQGFERPVRSEGSFLLAPGKGLIWRGEAPFPIVTAITPQGIVQSVGGKETTRISASKVPFLARLYDMMAGAMAGDWQVMEAEFAIARAPDGKATRYTLTPRRDDPTQPIRSIVAKVDRFVEEVQIGKPGGDRDILVFRDQSLGIASLGPDDVAVFDAAMR